MQKEMKRFFFTICLLMVAGVVLAEEDTTAQAVTEPVEEALPASTEALWDMANTAYINNEYSRAETIYNEILKQGESSAKLYYNLANACFKQEELGRAILYYHRALRLQPGDADIRYNLSVAEARTKDTIDEIPEFFLTTWMRALRHTMSSTAWSVVSILALVVMLSLVLFYLLARRLSLRKTGFYGMLVALFVFILTTWFAAAGRTEQIGEHEAVVVSLSAAVKASPDSSSTDLFVLHEGTVVEITNRLGDWCEVMIADGKKGWTQQGKIEVI